MTCGQARNALSAYADREMTGYTMLAVRAHLAQCDACALEAESVRNLKRALNDLPATTVPAGLESRLRATVRASRPARRERVTTAVVVATSSALAACLAVWYFNAAEARHAPANVANRTFDTQADQAYVAGSDPFGNHVPILPASYSGQ